MGAKIQSVLVTGGTGLIGSQLALELLRRGYSVSILTRDANRAKKEVSIPIRFVSWSDLTSSAASPSLPKFDAVIHLAGESVAGGRWTSSKKKRIYESRIQSTKELMRAFNRLPADLQPKRWINASAIGYFGDRGDDLLSIESNPGADFLARVCIDWEVCAFDKSVLPETERSVVRIGIVLSREGGALGNLIPLFQARLGGVVGEGRQWMSWIHEQDLVQLFVAALETPKLEPIYHGVSSGPVTNRDFIRALASALGVSAFLPAPRIAVTTALGEMSALIVSSQRVESHVPPAFQARYQSLSEALEDLVSPFRGGCSILSTTTWVPEPPQILFPFFSNPRNLERITPPFLNFRILRSSTPEVQRGTEILYSLKLHGVPMKWLTHIDHFESGTSFVDRQVKGPYHTWIHTHSFEPLAGGTLMRDLVRYKLPLGVIGKWTAGHWVKRDVQRIFSYRRSVISELFKASPIKSSAE